MIESPVFRPLERRLLAACLVLAPLVSLVCGVIFFSLPKQAGTGHALLLVCGAAYVGGLSGLAAALRERGARFGLLASLAAMVAVMPASIGAHRLTLLEVGQRLGGASEVGLQLQAVRAHLLPILVAPGVLFPLLLVPLGLCLLRSRRAPAWVALAFTVGFVLFPIGRIPNIAGAYFVGDVLILVACIWLAIRLVATPGRSLLVDERS